MAKDVIISTGGVNCYGSRVLTSGIDLTQFRKNPLLLWMHRRSFEADSMPIGRIENLRIDGDRLIGTPVFDPNDEFARKIESKWENGFLRMASAGIEILETSNDPQFLLPGQSRATILRSKLEEVSIVDMGANDEALQLYCRGGKVLKLAAGEDNDLLPLIAQNEENIGKRLPDPNHKTDKNMNKEILQLLGLSETATEQEAVSALRLLKGKADTADALHLAAITTLVDGAISERRITADKKEHFVSLGQTAGIESLRTTLSLMQPTQKPTDIIREKNVPGELQKFTKLSEVPDDKLADMRANNPAEYARLYKGEYGMEIKNED